MDRVLFGGLAALFLASLTLTLGPAPEAPRKDAPPARQEARPREADVAPRSRVYERAGGDLDRWLRGDWEPPDEILLVFTETWSTELAYLIGSALDQAHVTLLVDPTTASEGRIQRWFTEFNLPASEIRVRFTPLDSPWVRDYGPLQLMPARGRRGDPVWLDAEYVSDRPNDEVLPAALAPELGVEMAALPAALQGGAIISNGRGLCAITIEYCLEHGIDVDDPAVMDALLGAVGCQAAALVPDLKDDSTRHADMFAQFLADDVVAVARVEGAENAEDAWRMDEAARGLEEAAGRVGLKLRVARVPMPYFGAGRYLTYLNGLRLAEEFIVPSYKDAPAAIQGAAYSALTEALPGMKLVTVPADTIIQLSGSLHCISLGLTLPSGGAPPRR